MEKKIKAIVVYSGGMDSFTLLHKAIADGREVYPINFYYGQRHAVEIQCAEKVCADLGLQLRKIDISSLNGIIDNSALSGNIDIPTGHFQDESMKLTVVPNRNMMLLSMAAAYAINIKADEVWYGAHNGDHEIYPDCRPVFVEAMRKAFALADWHPVDLVVPFIDGNKETILTWGFEHNLDYADSWTCYDPKPAEGGVVVPCGKCGSCTERQEAFDKLGRKDPLVSKPV